MTDELRLLADDLAAAVTERRLAEELLDGWDAGIRPAGGMTYQQIVHRVLAARDAEATASVLLERAHRRRLEAAR